MSRDSAMNLSGNQARPVSYDQAPYPSLSYSQTHPDRIATVAVLLGLDPAPVERCRVLELGCAVGGNLIPMAEALPESHFVGIDVSARQIEEGQAVIDALGLRNISLAHMDIMDVGADLGRFDYIIAHGVFSWIPPDVQEKVFAVCRQNLADHGVGYVSYNTFPGWHMIQIVREAMRYHTRNVADPEERAGRARSFLSFLAEACPRENTAYASFLQMYAGILDSKLEKEHRRGASLLLHDELEEINEPTYFYQFVERAERNGLQYLAEAQFSSMMGAELQPEVRASLQEQADSLVELEQYLDFLRNRTFRQTLLCHSEVAVTRSIKPDPVLKLCASSRADAVSEAPDIHSRAVEKFRGQDGAVLSTDHPVSKAALLWLAEVWPQIVPFDGLLQAAHARLRGCLAPSTDKELTTGQGDERPPYMEAPGDPGSDDDDALVLAANLLRAYGYSDSLAELHSFVPSISIEVPDRPLASGVSRLQAREGDRVTNLRHERVTMDGFDRFLLTCLDGKHDRGALVDLLMEGPVAEGVLTLNPEAPSAEDGSGSEQAGKSRSRKEIKAVLGEEVDRRLACLARTGLLIAR